MAVRTRFLQIGIAIVNVAIVALVFTSVWPFPSGEFKVDLPSTNDITWSYSRADGCIHVVAPFSIDNGWIYDVDDLAISYMVTNMSNVVLAQDVIRFDSIPAGRVTDSRMDFAFNITDFYNDGGLGMVFADDSLHFEIDVSCLYTMKLIKFEASYFADVPWDALIQEYDVTDVSFTGSQVVVDYFVTTSSMLRSLGNVPMTLMVYSDGTPLCNPILTDIDLGTRSEDSITFTPLVPPSLTGPYEVRFTVLGFQFSWEGP